MKRSELFDPIEPPPGGLTRLRANLEPRPSMIWRPVLALVIAMICIALAWSFTRDEANLIGEARGSVFAELVGAEAVDAEPIALIAGQPGALQRLASSNPQIVLYRVGMLDPAMAPPEE